MADQKLIGKLESCPVCLGKVHEIDENEYGCEGCKRVWVYTGELWASKARKVIVVREPQEGDKLDDFLKPVD